MEAYFVFDNFSMFNKHINQFCWFLIIFGSQQTNIIKCSSISMVAMAIFSVKFTNHTYQLNDMEVFSSVYEESTQLFLRANKG